MDVTRLMSQTATITHITNSASVDEYGNPTATTTTTTSACYIAQARRFEARVDAATAEELWTGWFPAGTALDAGDQVTVGGVTYGVDGPPWRATNARTGDEELIEATLRRTS